MAESLTVKWGGSVAIATILWVVPIPLRADRAITTFALIGSVAGYGYALSLSKTLEKEWKRERQAELKEDKLLNYQMALSEKAEKRELEQLFSPVANAVSGISGAVSEMTETISRKRADVEPEQVSEISETPETDLWTSYKLSKSEAQAMIQQCLSQGMSKTQIIEFLWEAKPGSSKAYKIACLQYAQLTS